MKKIDTEKSTIFGVYADGGDNLKLGIRGYFSHYSNFETYTIGELDGFTYDEFMSIQEDPDGDYGNQWYNYFIPEDKVVFKEEEKEKKYRPYTLDEFLKVFTIGQPIRYRGKKAKWNRVLIFNGYEIIEDRQINITIGGYDYTPEDLFENFEWQESSGEEYKIFGVEY